MSHQGSSFREPIALALGEFALLTLTFRKGRPSADRMLIFGLGTLALLAGIEWYRRSRREGSVPKYQEPFDIVNEDSEESFPASDPPAWALGR